MTTIEQVQKAKLKQIHERAVELYGQGEAEKIKQYKKFLIINNTSLTMIQVGEIIDEYMAGVETGKLAHEVYVGKKEQLDVNLEFTKKYTVDIEYLGEVIKFTFEFVGYVKGPSQKRKIKTEREKLLEKKLMAQKEQVENLPSNQDFTGYLQFVRDLTHGLYPDDSTEQGRLLRLRQQYFLVSAGMQSMLRAHYRHYKTFKNLPEHYVFQLNDTHPIMAIPELMRLLMDEHNFGWDEAFEICSKCFAFTNHTVMAEALEKWPCHYIANLFPRIYMIIEEINRRMIIKMRNENLPENVIQNSLIIKDGNVHMCQMAIHVCFSVRGYCYDGMLLGDWIGEEGGFVKTFISRQEMKMNQFVEYFEFFKMWIIEDMFKSRKGFELKNSLTEYIPDTYFEYGEWDKFLFERDNLRLIKAAEESQEIYMKNREEYRRCFQLIDAVNINMFEKRKHI